MSGFRMSLDIVSMLWFSEKWIFMLNPALLSWCHHVYVARVCTVHFTFLLRIVLVALFQIEVSSNLILSERGAL